MDKIIRAIFVIGMAISMFIAFLFEYPEIYHKIESRFFGKPPVVTLDGNVYKTPHHVKKSIVKIINNRKVGTGFIVQVHEDKIYIITVIHVVEGNPTPTIEFLGNREFTAKILHTEAANNPEKGLVLLLLKNEDIAKEVSALYLSEKSLENFYVDLERREKVIFTYGFPRGGADWAYTQLIYSGQKGRELLFSGDIKEGNSGAPLVKENKVIGIITMRGQFVHATSVQTIKEFLISLGVFPNYAKPMMPVTTESGDKSTQAEPTQEIESLLKTCQSHFNVDRLTDSSACYQKVLEKAPSNAKALMGLGKIEIRYMQLIMFALQRKDRRKFMNYWEDLYRLNPKSPFLEELKKEELKNKESRGLLTFIEEIINLKPAHR
jgi:tetratricopeptide (TPR) repeat protein